MEHEESHEEQQFGYFKKMILTGQINRLIVIVTTIVAVTIFLVMAMLSLLGIFQNFGTPTDYFVLALLSGTGIFGMYEYMNVRRIYKIDLVFPDFVRDLAESRRAGMTFTKAIMFAARGNYGVLTEEIRKISQQVSWGSSVTDALKDFAKRVNTKSIRRTISLIIEASKSGGNVAEVLDIASKDAREIKMLEAERKANMSSYVVVIYVGMFVFLAIIMILNLSFIPAMTGSGSQGMAGIMGGGSVNAREVTVVFYFATLIQGFGSGLVAGVFEDGNISSSVKHVFVMVLIGWLAFKLMMGM
ncbi:MAG: type II secretion system F family protein [Candidatus Thermoplasmatota archaeon]|nr:type II secretion system F family protein [Candidatus Thermoplasmatota archaeon]MBU1940292.1 type II secretion system F family protein [Candidatus Thermoplasmatota archaeon]